jgi:hypothetical protein
MRVCRKNELRSSWAVRYFFLGGTLLFPERYAIDSWGVRRRSWAVRRSFLGGTLLFPGGYAIDEDPIASSFMGGTLFVGRARDRFSRKVRYISPGPSCVECSSHIAPVADASSEHSTRPCSSAVRYSCGATFYMGRTKTSWAVRYSARSPALPRAVRYLRIRR